MLEKRNLQKAFFWMGLVAAVPSVALYLLTPGGTVAHFGGEVNDTSKFWCSVAASGDVYVIAMIVAVLMNFDDEKLKKIVIRANWLYTVLHGGAFWYWHHFGRPHPQGAAMHPIGLAIASAALFAWGL
jgi:hypothetical protein